VQAHARTSAHVDPRGGDSCPRFRPSNPPHAACRVRVLQVQRNDSKFIFSVETTGSLAPEDVVQQALHVLRKKLTSLQKEVVEEMDQDQQRREVSDSRAA